MNQVTGLLKKENMGELVLVGLMVVYIVMGFKTPELVANMVDTLVGKIVIFLVVIYLFLNSNPILAVLALYVAFDLIRRSSAVTGIDALRKYAPTEERKSSQFTSFNQFPYTLEQEVVKKMAPIVQSGRTLTKPSYKPMLDNLHDASSLN